MELGPILRALMYNKVRFGLIALEVALTLAIVANCMNMILDQRAKMTRPTGLAEDQLLVIYSNPFSAEFDDKGYRDNSYAEDLRTIGALPGVVSVSAISMIPLSGGGSSAGRKVQGSDDETTSAPYFVVGPGAVQTLGVELTAGRDFVEADFPQADSDGAFNDNIEASNVLVTQNLADRLFPDGGALGGTIVGGDGEDPETIVGIIRQMHGSWPLSTVAERVMLVPGAPYSARRVRYMVRAEPEAVDHLYTSLETELVALDEGRIVEVETLKEVKADYYDEQIGMITILVGVSLLLVGVTSLGIVGLTAFSVTQRTRQIGTRRALGATRWSILRYFLVENWLITATGLTVGIVLTYGLNFLLAHVADAPRMEWPLVLCGMIVLWISGLLASLAPALRGTSVSPVIATRTV